MHCAPRAACCPGIEGQAREGRCQAAASTHRGLARQARYALGSSNSFMTTAVAHAARAGPRMTPACRLAARGRGVPGPRAAGRRRRH
ncbi:hypothetical protein BGLA2_380032 [Burkholderia gladioli]|nr:hypothetical protein BGLA2_380032 [Burkholderia gladioli]